MYGLLFAFARMDPIFLRCSCLGIDSSNLSTLGQHGSCSFSGQGAWKGHWPFMGPWDGERWWGSCSCNSCFEGQVLFCHICELKIIDSYLEVDFVAVMSVGADGGMLCLHCVIRILFVYIYREKCGGFSLAFSTRTFLHLWMLKPGRLHLVDLWAGRRCKWIQSNHLVPSLRNALMWQHWKWMRMSWSTLQGTRMCTRSLGMWISYTLAWQHWTAIGMILGKFSRFCGAAGAAIALRSSLWKQNILQDQHLWKQTFTIFCIYKVFFG